MAELRRSNLTLEWERLKDGRLAIGVGVVADLATGQRSETPLAMFVLSGEEEADLKETLNGLTTAQLLPGG